MKPTDVHGWLLDTHSLLWMLYDDPRLSREAREIIDGPLPIAYSTVSFWEIALKRSNKGFDFEIEDDWDIFIPRELHRVHVLRFDLEAEVCRCSESLPFRHRDPFDRMLIATAIHHRFGILSKDGQFDAYDGVLRAW